MTRDELAARLGLPIEQVLAWAEHSALKTTITCPDCGQARSYRLDTDPEPCPRCSGHDPKDAQA